MADLSAADVGALMGGHGGMGTAGGLGLGAGILGGLFLGSLINGGWGFGGGRGAAYGAGFANAIGYENLATSNEVQRGFDNQNAMANQRDILSAVTAGTAQAVAATNNTFHDTLAVLNDKYSEITRDVSGVATMIQQGIANQNACCCDTKMLIQETAGQNRYDALANTAALQASMAAGFNSLKEKLDQNEIAALKGQIADLRLANQMAGVVRYPNGMYYNAGPSPFCPCNSCGC